MSSAAFTIYNYLARAHRLLGKCQACGLNEGSCVEYLTRIVNYTISIMCVTSHILYISDCSYFKRDMYEIQMKVKVYMT